MSLARQSRYELPYNLARLIETPPVAIRKVRYSFFPFSVSPPAMCQRQSFVLPFKDRLCYFLFSPFFRSTDARPPPSPNPRASPWVDTHHLLPNLPNLPILIITHTQPHVTITNNLLPLQMEELIVNLPTSPAMSSSRARPPPTPFDSRTALLGSAETFFEGCDHPISFYLPIYTRSYTPVPFSLLSRFSPLSRSLPSLNTRLSVSTASHALSTQSIPIPVRLVPFLPHDLFCHSDLLARLYEVTPYDVDGGGRL
jgi:hypothetical protein